ncbi:MAG: right-handed parallel beta-helix repeat-containing protein [Planctomycetota bacterium]
MTEPTLRPRDLESTPSQPRHTRRRSLRTRLTRITGFCLVAAVLIASPALTAMASQDLHVSSFGAVGDGVHNDAPAIRQAIQAAIDAGSGTTLSFDERTYRLGPSGDLHYQFKLDGVKGLRIQGNGATLLNTPEHGIFETVRCTDVEIGGFVVDYDPLPFTQGTITRINPAQNSFLLEIADGYEVPSADTRFSRWSSVMDPNERHRRWDLKMHLFYKGVEPVPGSPRTVRVTVDPQWQDDLKPINRGDRFFLSFRRGPGGSNFRVTESTDCTFHDIKFYATRYGMAFGVRSNEGRITLRRIEIRFKPGTDRLIASHRDGMHCKDNKIGPLIEDCYFEGLKDDSLNIGGNTGMARSVISSRVFDLMGAPFRPDDEVLVFDPDSGQALARTKVVNVEPGRVELAHAIRGVVPGTKKPHQDRTSTHFYNLSRSSADFIVRNCTFKAQRRHAMLIRAPRGLIENNTIDGVGGSAVFAGNEAGSFYEGPFPEGLVIRNNTIRNTQLPAIWLLTSSLSGEGRLTRDIRLENNNILAAHAPAIQAARVAGVRVTGGQIAAGRTLPAKDSVVSLGQNIAGVRFSGVRFEDQRRNSPGVFALEGPRSSRTLAVSSSCRFDLARGVEHFAD